MSDTLKLPPVEWLRHREQTCRECLPKEAAAYPHAIEIAEKYGECASTILALTAEVERFRTSLAGAVGDIASERQRQVSKEGWSHEHDDEHTHDELAKAGACYALPESSRVYRTVKRTMGVDEWMNTRGGSTTEKFTFPTLWPWAPEDWKPDDRRRELVKAGALIVAEIERLDRLTTNPRPARRRHDTA